MLTEPVASIGTQGPLVPDPLCEGQMDDRIDDIDTLLNDTLTTGMRSKYVCRDCGEKSIVAIQPKAPFRPVFDVATTKGGSGVLLLK